MHIQRSRVNRHIYAIGGFNGKQRLKTIEEYNVVKNEWRLLEFSLPFGLTNSSAVSVNESKILVFGGGYF